MCFLLRPPHLPSLNVTFKGSQVCPQWTLGKESALLFPVELKWLLSAALGSMEDARHGRHWGNVSQNQGDATPQSSGWLLQSKQKMTGAGKEPASGNVEWNCDCGGRTLL